MSDVEAPDLRVQPSPVVASFAIDSRSPSRPSPLIEVRLAIAAAAARTLSEPRLRRLLEIETQDVATITPGPSGPLGNHVALVWVDQPTPAKIVVEVRVGDRPVERREIAVRGLAGDVAARLVAMATSEMIRDGMVPVPKPQSHAPTAQSSTGEDFERSARTALALTFAPAVEVASLPAAGGVLAGPSLAVGFRMFGLSETISGRWMTGAASGTNLRWLDGSLAVEYRIWHGPLFRVSLGGVGSVSSVHLTDARVVGGTAADRDTWSARAGGVVSAEVRVAAPLWISLGVQPGAILRPIQFVDGAGKGRSIEGAFVDFGLAVLFEPALR